MARVTVLAISLRRGVLPLAGWANHTASEVADAAYIHRVVLRNLGVLAGRAAGTFTGVINIRILSSRAALAEIAA
jgi:hypothetical protein